MTTLYGYFRSSAAYRVRIALNLKNLAYDQAPINLVKGEQRDDAFLAHNPQGLVPMLMTDNGIRLTQSLAICEYLDERYPEPALLPGELEERARVRALAQVVACEIHPLDNLRVLKYLVNELGVEDDAKQTWYRHWIHQGFSALESMLSRESGSGDFCHGDAPTLADICLVPQVFNAERFECDLSAYPRIRRITENARALDAFRLAAPGEQPDAN
ncbi:maleylacetoacetate isomerase [Halomonas elongata]|uniref:Maleylacetoacetate isomerase n=1 Tax=Halomonas elongata (strain ATCC 33173 / DSM 2581 / NBRC 15536 / NCIMB 2198 / 1H9) TaxID=768066 RepID=E1V4B2_HALED|nr:maleylacetoacetate isomerase [Halomonas elongata]WBF18191.1 maleylacetoacetate isomerase [Halomonas elongata]WPU47042.1 maleylacetoacetate isomerase [Halomonas elongata DSM 2581]CBV40949.1 maleylacetoacetate isomerase [Halomonas elongata DSM 2581]